MQNIQKFALPRDGRRAAAAACQPECCRARAPGRHSLPPRPGPGRRPPRLWPSEIIISQNVLRFVLWPF